MKMGDGMNTTVDVLLILMIVMRMIIFDYWL